MTRSNPGSVVATVLVGATLALVEPPVVGSAPDSSDLSGRWSLNRELSEFPREAGFAVDWVLLDGSGFGPGAEGRRGERGSTGSGGAARPFIAPRESEADARRRQLLTAEVRNPPALLTVAETPTTVTITNDRGQSRTFHPEGKEEALQIEGVAVAASAKREAGRLVVVYAVEQGRHLRYSYYRVPQTSQLAVDVQFVERGGGDSVRRIYDPAGPEEVGPPLTPGAVSANADAASSAGAAPAPAGAAQRSGAPAPAAASSSADPPPNQRPDAELIGLSQLGLVVEDLSPEAAACGLSQKTFETTLSKRLSDAGIRILRNSDEDSYVYVNINTAKVSTGLCVSRYDVFLYTHATARLSYQQAPVLVQVSLLHTGGIGGGAPAAHAATVLRDVQEYVDQFVVRIRNAGK